MRRLLALLVVLALAISMVRVLAPVPVTVYGYVYMPDGSPAAGATVKVSGGGASETTTTDSSGAYMVTLSVESTPITVTVTATKGSYSKTVTKSNVEGAVRIDLTLEAPAPAPTPTPTKTSTSLSISIAGGPTFSVNSSVVIKGSIYPAMSASIQVKVVKPSGKTVVATVTSAGDGSFSYSLIADEVGVYYVTAYFSGTDQYSASSSSTLSFSVKQGVSVSASLSGVQAVGNLSTASITGKIVPAAPNVPVQLFISFDNKTWVMCCSTTTSADGSFSLNSSLPVYGKLYFKIVVPETPTSTGFERVLTAYIKSPREAELEKENSRLSEENSKLSKAVADLNQKLAASNSTINSLRSENAKLASDLSSANQKVSSLTAQLQEAERSISSLSAQLESAKTMANFGIPAGFIVGLLLGAGVGYYATKRRAAAKK